MEKEEYLNILRFSPKKWNAWRQEHSNETLYLEDFNFTNLSQEQNLLGFNFNNCVLKRANFADVNLEGATFENADAEGAIFYGSDLTGAQFVRTNLKDAKFDVKTRITHTSFNQCKSLEGVDLENLDLSGVVFSQINKGLSERNFSNKEFEATIFNQSNLESVSFSNAKIHRCSFNGAKLGNASFEGAEIEKTSFNETDLSNTKIESARNLYKIECVQAVLTGRNFNGKILNESRFNKAKLLKTNFTNATLHHVDFSDSRYLTARALAGSDLLGAKLPDYLQEFKSLKIIEEASKNAKTLFVTMLFLCFYTLIAVWFAETKSGDLIKLPFIGFDVEKREVCLILPALLFMVFLYFQFYLQRIWRQVTYLPAVFEDGVPLPERIFPWLLNAFTWRHLKLIVTGEYKKYQLPLFQYIAIVFFAWWAAPITVLSVGFNYLMNYKANSDIIWLIIVAYLVPIFVSFICFCNAKKTLKNE